MAINSKTKAGQKPAARQTPPPPTQTKAAPRLPQTAAKVAEAAAPLPAAPPPLSAAPPPLPAAPPPLSAAPPPLSAAPPAALPSVQMPPSGAPAEPSLGSGVFTLNLAALQHNYRVLRQRAHGAEVAGVVKADAYGLGAAAVAPALYDAGCRLFFVAQLAEAFAVRQALAEKTALLRAPAQIAILNDVLPQEAPAAAKAGFIPVLNSLESLRFWADLCGKMGRKLPAMLQCDSGMARLGLDEDELVSAPPLLKAMEIRAVLSHLACGDDERNPLNEEQRRRFLRHAGRLGAASAGAPRLSLAASCGLAFGAEFCLDIVRPGIALYGFVEGAGEGRGNKADELYAALRPVLRLEARVLRIGKLALGETVGYGALYKAARPMPIATLSVGYADGWPRSLGNKGAVYYQGARLPIIGRLSMDCMVVDLSPLAAAGGAAGLARGSLVELIGAQQSLHQVAKDAGTIPHEILTSLGRRFCRRIISA